MTAEGLFCFLCYLPHSAIRRDKRGVPYFKCNGCGCRMFFRTEAALNRLCELLDEARVRSVQIISEQVRAAAARPAVPSISLVTNVLSPQAAPVSQEVPK